jgi:HAD superfamily hydrolase (TIGR01509 family)
MIRIYHFFSKIVTFFLVFAFTLSIAKPRERSKTRPQERLFSGKVIAWDLHDVLFFEKPSLFRAFWNYPQKRKLIPKGKMRKIIWKEVKRYLFGKKKQRLNSSELITLAQQYDAPDIAEFIIQHETACVPDPDMVALIKDLQQQGYRQYICSNISQQGLAVLQERHPDFFSYFDGTYATKQNNSRKPHDQFFLSFLEHFHLQPSDVLFIDDKRDNCASARKLGMHTVRFKKHKRNRQRSIKKIRSVTTQRQVPHKRIITAG